MHCAKCQSRSYCKNGTTKGKQRYRCRDCGYNFTNTHGRGHSPDKRLAALHLYKEGVGFSGIGRIVGVSDVTVMNWVKAAGEKIKETLLTQMPASIDGMDIIEIDEMWHYTQKNSASFGYGLLCLAPSDASSPPAFAGAGSGSGLSWQKSAQAPLGKDTVPFDDRSKGFVWFFSFMVYFSQLKQKEGEVILLLDEPGLNLHARAQEDFLRVIDERLAPKYQVGVADKPDGERWH